MSALISDLCDGTLSQSFGGNDGIAVAGFERIDQRDY